MRLPPSGKKGTGTVLDLAVDANVVLKWIPGKNETRVEEARDLYTMMLEGKCQIWSPKFLLVEVLNILIKKRKANPEIVSTAMVTLLKGKIKYWEMEVGQVKDLEKLMRRYSLTAYDAQYLLLARQLKCKLVSYDEELLKITDWVVGVKDVFLSR